MITSSKFFPAPTTVAFANSAQRIFTRAKGRKLQHLVITKEFPVEIKVLLNPTIDLIVEVVKKENVYWVFLTVNIELKSDNAKDQRLLPNIMANCLINILAL